MQAWPQVAVPEVHGPQVQVFDSVTGTQQALPISGDTTLYVCGITPYDATHMGHAATYVAFDVLIRAWKASGANVRYTQNVTDIDDPLIERAIATGKPWEEIASEQTELFRNDMTALRVIAPDAYIGAVESIPLVVKQIRELQQAGCVYDLDGDLYYDIAVARTLGQVAHLNREEMIEIFSQRGGDPQRTGKRDPLDALLWRHERPNDPAWETELGSGRPGWHIECAAIALEYLGPTITVQGGGSDLKFPHHEMSAAHAESATGKQPFAKIFMHTGMVGLNGQKMSKSLGNLVFVSQLRKNGTDPMAIRLAIMAHHYRTDWEWFDQDLVAAGERLNLWRAAFKSGKGTPDVSHGIAKALADDLDTPTALSIIDTWASHALTGPSEHSDSTIDMAQVVDAFLGIV